MGLFDFSGRPTPEHDALGERIIAVNDSIKNDSMEYIHNGVSTGKYNVLTFIPLFLKEQFLTKYANMFFLLTGTVQMLPDVSPTSRFGTLLPLSIVMLFTAGKEVLEDAKRHRQDYEINTRQTKVLRGSQFVDVAWQDLKVGDVVRIENSEFFPADIVLLSSSEPDAICYIETANLDGETNLKIRQGIPETSDLLTPESVSRINATIKSELPNNSLYTFDATLVMDGGEYPLSPDQLLLRGAQLRNTRWVYGVVVFTGHETKLVKNATAAPIKRTKVELMVNSQIIYLFMVLFVMAVVCASGSMLRQEHSPFEQNVLMLPQNASGLWLLYGKNILTFICLFNQFIPLSLIVTMEFVKFAIAFTIDNDLEVYYEESDVPTQSRTSSLVEELGQIDYIFSDKTGTLTRNIMEFKMASIGGLAYAETVPDDKRIQVGQDGKEMGYYDFKTLNQHKSAAHPNSKSIDEFLTLLSVCHTVIPEHDETQPGKLIYQASSPDEAALVQGAKTLGYLFHTRRPRSVTIAVHGKNMEYEILNVNEFNSTRKRMSVVVRTPDRRVKIFVKGADTVIFERLGPVNPFLEPTSNHLEEYASEGLRTLVFAYRELSEEEYAAWRVVYDDAATTLHNRQGKLDEAAELIEKDLVLLGATAIEDKLQEGAPDTIHTLMDAGIKMWVLTGDRQETAINIGYSCKLLTPEMSVLICNEETHFETKEFLEQRLINVKSSMGLGRPPKAKRPPLERFLRNLTSDDAEKFDKDYGFEMEPLALVIDGHTLAFALESDICEIFLELAMLCKAVVCCRVSPLQKALVVQLVRNHVSQVVTLAIGDGANDVSMIQEAHVGVGISGQEGMQAVRSSDFAIGQFRYLRKLLLVHGSWSYARITKVIVYSFYKNITLQLIQLLFAMDNGFSGQTLFETWSSLASYNVVWTMIPPFVIGIFDQFLSARLLDRYPALYRIGRSDMFYNNRVFLGCVGTALLHAMTIYFCWRWTLGESAIMQGGLVADNWSWGQMVFATDLITVSIKACLLITTWVSFTAYALFGSLLAFFVLFPLVTLITSMLPLAPTLDGHQNFTTSTSPSSLPPSSGLD